MKPLLYLTYRQFVNGAMRALGNPRRLISFLALVVYWFWMFIMPTVFRSGRMSVPGAPKLDFPAIPAIDALLFVIFSILSLFMMIGLASQQAAFKAADVDVLFPTPVNPKLVLAFRIGRDYLLTLVIPFVLVLFGLRPVMMGWESFFRSIPNAAYGGLAVRGATVGWFLMAMAWVVGNYAISLFINRSDKASDRNRRILSWSVTLFIAAVIAFIVWSFRNVTSVAEGIEVAHSPILRAVMFPATLATHLAMAGLTGNWWLAAGGFFGLVGVIFVSLRVAMSQVGWMYDQAAVRGFDGASNLKDLQRKGDVMGIAAELARKGKLKVRRDTFVHRWNMSGRWALLWKEVFLQTRGMTALLFFLGAMTFVMVIIPILAPSGERRIEVGGLFLMMQGFALMSVTMTLAQIGFIEVLRRVDTLKPLPFSSFETVTIEVLARGLIGALFCIVGAIATTAIRPQLWEFTVSSILLAPCASFLMSAVVFLVTMMFPDVEDNSQRQFRGLVTLLALGIAGAPPLIALLVGIALKAPILASAAVAGVVAILTAGLCCLISSSLYASFNPSE